MHFFQFGITFADSWGPVNSDGPIHCIRSLNRMVRYSVMPLPGKTYDVAAVKTRTKGKLNPAANLDGCPGISDHPLFCQQYTYCQNQTARKIKVEVAYITALISPNLSRPPPTSCQANPVASQQS